MCCDNVSENQPCFFGNRKEPVVNLNNWMTEWLSTCTMLCGLLCQWQGPTQMHPQAAPEQEKYTSARKIYKNKPTKNTQEHLTSTKILQRVLNKKNLAKYIETGEFGCSIKKKLTLACASKYKPWAAFHQKASNKILTQFGIVQASMQLEPCSWQSADLETHGKKCCKTLYVKEL